jgi:F0F1-type ATP synthase assembly protein I
MINWDVAWFLIVGFIFGFCIGSWLVGRYCRQVEEHNRRLSIVVESKNAELRQLYSDKKT